MMDHRVHYPNMIALFTQLFTTDALMITKDYSCLFLITLHYSVFGTIKIGSVDNITATTAITTYNNFANFPQAALVMIRLLFLLSSSFIYFTPPSSRFLLSYFSSITKMSNWRELGTSYAIMFG